MFGIFRLQYLQQSQVFIQYSPFSQLFQGRQDQMIHC